MEHRPLGRTGVSVSKLCLGAMMFGEWGNQDHEESIRIIDRALGAGINFIDTADVYGQGESEVIVGKALAAGKRDDVVLATKVWGQMGGDPNRRGVSRRWIVREVEESLRRLNTDWIDLYQIHRYEPDVDLEETLGALSDLVHQGKVRYIGHSTFPASIIAEAQWTARDRGVERYVTEQPPYSILVRAVEASSSSRGSPTRRGPHPAGDRLRPQPPRHHRGDHRPTHDGAPRESARRPTSSSTRTCSTASTRSSRPARLSIPPTTPGTTPRSRPPRAGAER
ncbi:MAG TPA: aldo/keto reductase [Solirubrobacteraceae bacterium]|nr:aldo/keto reductase [Solirubrobacteraceae bacterium]